MNTIKNSISVALSIVGLAMSIVVIQPDHAMAKERKPRGGLSASNGVPRTHSRHITDGTSNTIMVGRSAAGVISPRDTASGLPTGIVSNNRGNRSTPSLRGRRNHHPR